MHTFLALDMNIIPQSTKDNVPSFWRGKFSNDQSRMLIDGHKDNGDLVHPMQVLKQWLVGFSDEEAELKINELLSTAIEYTKEEFKQESSKPESIWYEEV